MNFDSKKETVISIVAYNAVESIKRCLQSLEWVNKYDDIQVTVYDNSRNRKIERAVKKTPFEYLQAPQNVGFGRGHNAVFQHNYERHKHEYTLLLNPDTTLDESDYLALREVIDTDEKIAIVGPQIVRGNVQEKSVSTDPSGLGYFFAFTTQLITHGSKGFGLVAPDESGFVKGVTGACMMIDNSIALSSFGIFDPDYFMYFEDQDLCARMRKEGYKIYYDNDIVVTHELGASSETFTNRSRWILEMMYKSLTLYFRKNKSLIDRMMLGFSLRTALLLRILINKDRKWSAKLLKDLRKV